MIWRNDCGCAVQCGDGAECKEAVVAAQLLSCSGIMKQWHRWCIRLLLLSSNSSLIYSHSTISIFSQVSPPEDLFLLFINAVDLFEWSVLTWTWILYKGEANLCISNHLEYVERQLKMPRSRVIFLLAPTGIPLCVPFSPSSLTAPAQYPKSLKVENNPYEEC